MLQTRAVSSTRNLKYKYKYSAFKYEYKYKYQRLKYKYKYKHLQCTGWSKKVEHRYKFCDNSCKCTPILTAFLLLQQEMYDA